MLHYSGSLNVICQKHSHRALRLHSILFRIRRWTVQVKLFTVNENTTQYIRLENPLLINSIQFLIVFLPVQLKSLTQNTLLNCLINHCRKIEVFDRDILVQSLREASPLKALEASGFFFFKLMLQKRDFINFTVHTTLIPKTIEYGGEREKETHTHTLSFKCPIHKNIAYTCACPSGGKSIFLC